MLKQNLWEWAPMCLANSYWVRHGSVSGVGYHFVTWFYFYTAFKLHIKYFLNVQTTLNVIQYHWKNVIHQDIMANNDNNLQ